MVKQTVLLIVVQLKSSSLLATQYTPQRLVDESLGSNWQVLFEVVVERDAMINIFEELYVLLQVFQVQLLLSLVEKRPVSLVGLEPPCFLL